MSRYFVPKEFIFTQSVPSDLWVIKHACGYPSIDIFVETDGKLEKIIPNSVEYISDGQCNVGFTRPFAGMAKLAG